MRDAPQSGPNKWLPVQLATCNTHTTHNMQLPALPSANFNDSNEDIQTGRIRLNGGWGISNIFGNICDNQRTMKAHTNETEVSPAAAAVDDVASGSQCYPPPPAAIYLIRDDQVFSGPFVLVFRGHYYCAPVYAGACLRILNTL